MMYSDDFQNSVAKKMHQSLFLKCQKFLLLGTGGTEWFFLSFFWEPGNWKQLLAPSHGLDDAVILTCKHASWSWKHWVPLWNYVPILPLHTLGKKNPNLTSSPKKNPKPNKTQTTRNRNRAWIAVEAKALTEMVGICTRQRTVFVYWLMQPGKTEKHY